MNLRQSLSVKEFNLPSLNRTRMTQIKRIFTDPCASASSARSVFYRSIFHPILYTKVNKTDNHGALKYKQEIAGQICKQPSISRRLCQRRRTSGVWGSQPPAPLLKQTKSENVQNKLKEPFFK
jgi:hypothetical protein